MEFFITRYAPFLEIQLFRSIFLLLFTIRGAAGFMRCPRVVLRERVGVHAQNGTRKCGGIPMRTEAALSPSSRRNLPERHT